MYKIGGVYHKIMARARGQVGDFTGRRSVMAKSQVGRITKGEISRFPCTFMYIYYTRLDYINFLIYNYVHHRPNYAL